MTLNVIDEGKACQIPTLDSLEQLQQRIDALERHIKGAADPDALNMLVFDFSRDRLLAAFVIATGAAATGMKVSMFFTFWGTAALKKGGPQVRGKSLIERMFGWMLPGSARQTNLSRMHMCGLGSALMQREMKKKNVSDLDELMATAADLGVRIQVCEMSMSLMGIRREELIDYPGLEFCGASSFAEQMSRSNTTLFI